MPPIPLPPEVADLVTEAEALCQQADDTFGVGCDENAVHDKANRLARKALKAFRSAAKLAPTVRLRLPILMRALHVAGTMEEHEVIVRIVKQAVACRPNWDDMEVLRGYWNCSMWDDKPFPEMPPDGCEERDRRPAEGQMSFLEG